MTSGRGDSRGGFKETICGSSFSMKTCCLAGVGRRRQPCLPHRSPGAAWVLGWLQGPDVPTAVQAIRGGSLWRALPDRGAAVDTSRRSLPTPGVEILLPWQLEPCPTQSA